MVATVMSNLGPRALSAIARTEAGAHAVGDRYVLEHMREHGYNVGGEHSGHIILSDYATTGDGFVAALQVLAVVKKQDKPVSQVCHRFDPLPQVLKNVRYRSGSPLENDTGALGDRGCRAAAERARAAVVRPPEPSPSSASWARVTMRWSKKWSTALSTR